MRVPLAVMFAAWGLAIQTTVRAEDAKPPATQPAASDTSQFLIVLTTDSNPPADRLAAAGKLLQLKASDALQGVLAKGSPAARKIVCEAVRAAPAPELIDALILQLAEADASVVASAGQALAAYQDNGVSAKLSAVARDAKQPEVLRVAAVRTLGVMHHNAEALKALVGIFADEGVDLTIREVSRRALRGEEYQLLVTAYKELSAAYMSRLDVAGQADHQLANLKSPIPEIRRTGLKWALDQKGANTLKSDSPIVAQIRSMLGDPDPDVRSDVLRLMTALKDPKDADAVLAQYPKEQAPAVRRIMLEALGGLANPAAIPVEVAALKDSSDEIAIAAAGALGQLCANITAAAGKTIPPDSAKLVAAALLDLGKTPDAGKRNAEAFSAMAKIGDPSFATVFASMLAHKEAAIRQQAVVGLGMIGDANLLAPLRSRLAEDPDPTVRSAIVEVLSLVGKTDQDLATIEARLNPQTEADEKVRAAASSALMKALEARPPAEIREWAGKFDPKSPERLTLLMFAEAKLAKANPAKPAELTTCRVDLADTYVAQGKPADAVRFYQAALDNHLSSQTPDAKECVPLAAKYMTVLLSVEPLEKNIDNVAKYAAAPVGGLKEQIGKSLLTHIQALAAANQHDQVLRTVDIITAKVPDRFGGDIAAQLTAAELAAARAIVKSNLPNLKDAGKKDAAVKALTALGKHALRPLAEEWRAVYSAEKPDTTLEALLLEVLAQIDPSVKSQKLDTKEQKEAFVAPIIK